MRKEDFLAAIDALEKGNIIVYPTDTLYALGADVFNEDAVRFIYELKRRPFSHPLPIAVSNFDEIKKIALTNEMVEKVVKCFLPGALTIILQKRNNVSDLVTGGLSKVAIRIPRNEVALELLSAFGPLTVTSANRFGEKTPYVIKDLQMLFKQEVSVYLDDGRLDGDPSTIVDLTFEDPVIVREGPISRENVLEAI